MQPREINNFATEPCINDAKPEPDNELTALSISDRSHRRDKSVFLYRYSSKVQSSLEGYCWRIIAKHPSMHVYYI